MKYTIITKAWTATGYEVEAESPEQAGEKFWNGDYNNSRELSDYELDSDETVLGVQLAQCGKCGRSLEWWNESICPDSDLHGVSE